MVEGDMRFERRKLEGFPMKMPKEVLTLLVVWIVVVI
jgi:hypothetical protein